MSQVLCHLVAGVLTCAPFDISQIVDQRLREECRDGIEMCRSMNVTDPRGECMRVAARACPKPN
jgi:hypothetical protein